MNNLLYSVRAFFVFLGACHSIVHAQTTGFQKLYGGPGSDIGFCIISTNGHLLIAGQTTPAGSFDTDACLMLLDGSGNVLWQKGYGGLSDDAFFRVTEANDGGFLAFGTSRSFGQGSADLFLVKTDADGNVQWTRTWGGNGDDNAGALLRLPDGYVISAPESSFGSGIQTFAARIDNNGNSVWENLYAQTGSCDIRFGYAGGDTLFAAGKAGGAGCFVRVNASTGKVISTRLYDAIGSDILFSLYPAGDGNFILAETTTSPSGGDTISQWTCKTSRSGDLIWSKAFTKPGANIRGSAIPVSDGGVLVTSLDLSNFQQADPMLVKLNASGETEWMRAYGGPGADQIFQSVETPDGGFVSVGYRTVSPGNNDIYLLKTDATGRVQGCCSETAALLAEDFLPAADSFSLDTLHAPAIDVQSIHSQDIALNSADYCGLGGAVFSELEIGLCPGQQFFLNGNTYDAPAVVKDTLLSGGGCDSIVTYTLVSVPKPVKTENVAFCPGDAVVIQGIAYNEPGTVIALLPSPTGCDTLATYHLSFLPLPARTETVFFHPGDSVVIGGIVYTAAGTVTDTVPASTGCDTLVTYILALDYTIPDTCDAAASFLKKYGEPDKYDVGNVMCASADGNLYIAGEKEGECLLMKVSPSGDVLWSRVFRPDPLLYTHISWLMEDSDGMLAGCGIIGEGDLNLKSYAFRYNPLTNSMMWSKTLKQESPEAYRILEISPGGNFLLLTSPQLTLNVDDAEMWELNRNTGALAGGLTRRYNFGISDVFTGMVIHDGAIYAAGRHIPGFAPPSVTKRSRMGLSKIDLATGVPVWSRLSHIDTAKVANLYGQDLLIHDGAVMVLCNGPDSSDLSISAAFFVQKTSLDGDLQWIKRYSLPGAFGVEANQILETSDGFMLVARAYLTISDWNLLVIKTDFDGNVLWTKKVPIVSFSGAGSTNLLGFRRLAASMNDVLYLTGATGNFPADLLFLKMTPDGETGDSCAMVQPVDLEVKTVPDPVNIPVDLIFNKFFGQMTNTPVVVSPTPMPASTLCVRCSCTDSLDLGPDVVLCKVAPVTFNAGSGFVSYRWQDGSSDSTYAAVAPGLYWVEAKDACGNIFRDSVTLTAPNTAVSIKCPADIDIATPPGAGPAAVQYALPPAGSDCACPGIVLAITEGLPSGSLFPVTTTKVCYEAADSCGSTASCCFNVTVREEALCDEKTSGCLTYELLSIAKGAGTDLTYEIRVTNHCAAKMIYTAIQLPDGMAAVKPPDNTVFAAPGGRAYDVRNPNYSPFYSIRFKSLTDSISNGQSDVFTYTLAGQTKPDYIHITSKLYPQAFYEAYLNTFNCPVKMPSNDKPEGVSDRDAAETAGVPPLTLFPNPTSGVVFADLSAWQGKRVRVRIFNSQGQRLQETVITASDEPQAIGLPENLGDGLYFLEAAAPDGRERSARFIKRKE